MIDVTCAIILKEEKFLVTQRGPEMSLPYMWEFPGGKIEANETAEESIIREIQEELGVNIFIKQQLPTFTHYYEDISINLIPFIAELQTGAIQLSEHSDYKWLSKEELLELDWAPADLPIVKFLIEKDHA